jgi:hypothetical protein
VFDEDGVVPGAVALRDAFADADGAVTGGVVLGDAGPILRADRGLQSPRPGGVGGGDLLVQQGFARTSSGCVSTAMAIVCRTDTPDVPPQTPRADHEGTRRPDRVLSTLRLLEVLTTVTALAQRVELADLGS